MSLRTVCTPGHDSASKTETRPKQTFNLTCFIVLFNAAVKTWHSCGRHPWLASSSLRHPLLLCRSPGLSMNSLSIKEGRKGKLSVLLEARSRLQQSVKVPEKARKEGTQPHLPVAVLKNVVADLLTPLP